jgi:type II secretory pathway component PulL
MWHKVRAQSSQSGADRPGVSAILISTLPTCQGGLMHGVSDTQSRWRLSWVSGRARVWMTGQGLVRNCLKSMVELTHSTYKYPHTPFGEIEKRK